MVLNDRTYGLVVTVPPAVEPVTLDEMTEWCRVDSGDNAQNGALAGAIQTARERCEEICDLALVTRTLKLTFDVWPHNGIISLPRAPLQSVTSLKYIDVATGLQATMPSSDYTVDTTSKPGRIVRAYYAYWPAIRWQPAALEVTYVAGYGGPASVPQAIKDRIKTAAAYCFRNREMIDLEYLDRLFLPFQVGTAP